VWSVIASLFLLGSCFAGENKRGVSLADYLKRTGCEQVPLKRAEHHPLNNRFYVTAQINGREHNFNVDTGCSFTTLDVAVTRQFKTLGEMGAELDDSLLGRLTNHDFVIIDKLTLGRAQFLNQPARGQKFSMDFIRVGFDGILGVDFFFRNHCLIDCRGPSLFVRANKPSEESSRALRASLMNSGYMPVPLRVGACLTAEAKVNNEPVTLMLDTGADFTTIDQAIAKRLNLRTVNQKQPSVGTMMSRDITLRSVGMGEIGAHETHVTVLKAFAVGQHAWTNYPACVTALSYWNPNKSEQPKFIIEGLLGADFLASNDALIDCAEGTLWLRPSK
jgi:hypothetical protein